MSAASHEMKAVGVWGDGDVVVVTVGNRPLAVLGDAVGRAVARSCVWLAWWVGGASVYEGLGRGQGLWGFHYVVRMEAVGVQ